VAILATGALAGWARQETRHGVVMTLQIATSAEAFRQRQFDEVNVVLNERQLRSLARDLARSAEARGIELSAKRSWWRFGRYTG